MTGEGEGNDSALNFRAITRLETLATQAMEGKDSKQQQVAASR